MPNTLAHPGPYDPTLKTEPNEPVFLLAAHDPDAPETVKFWAKHRRDRISAQIFLLNTGQKVPDDWKEDLRQCTEADFIAMDMERWAARKPEEEAIRGERLRHGLDKRPDDDDADARHIIDMAREDLRESAYYASEARDKLAKAGVLEPSELVEIEECLAKLNAIADKHTVTRPGFQPQMDLQP